MEDLIKEARGYICNGVAAYAEAFNLMPAEDMNKEFFSEIESLLMVMESMVPMFKTIWELDMKLFWSLWKRCLISAGDRYKKRWANPRRFFLFAAVIEDTLPRVWTPPSSYINIITYFYIKINLRPLFWFASIERTKTL